MKAFGKSILRTVAHSKSRSAAVFAIVALGAGFAAGVFSVAPQMRETVDGYLDGRNFMDVQIVSTLGFSENDAKAVRAEKGVDAVMPTRQEDVISRVAGEDVALRIHALPEQGAEDAGAGSMNRPLLLSGRWPRNADECVLDSAQFLPEKSLKAGDTVTVEEQGGKSLLKAKKFRIVGFVESPAYLSYVYGSTDIGNGQLSHFLYVPPQAFTGPDYTCLYVRVKGAAALDCFTQEYRDAVAPIRSALEKAGKRRASARRAEVVADAQKALDDGRADYGAQKQSAELRLSGAKAKLDEAAAQLGRNRAQLAGSEARLAEGKSALAEARASYAAGQKTYAAEKRKAQGALAAAEEKLKGARAELDAARKKLADSETRLADGERRLAQAQAELDGNRQELEAAQAQLDEKGKQLEEARSQLDGKSAELREAKAEVSRNRAAWSAGAGKIAQAGDALAQLEAAGQGGSSDAEALRKTISTYEQQGAALSAAESKLADGKRQLAQAQAELDESGKQLDDARQQLDAKKKQLDEAQTQLDEKSAGLKTSRAELESGKSELAEKETELERGEAAYRRQKADAGAKLEAAAKKLDEAEAQLSGQSAKLAEAETQLESGKARLASAEKDLEKGRSDYESSRDKARRSLGDAKAKLDAAQKKIDAVKEPVWYVLDRDKNVGFHSFTEDAGRMEAIARMFPVFFFLVAALVVLTTMTRMVEEERSEIGAYKALGFSKEAVARRYLIYAVMVSLSGGLAGVVAGCLTLPSACWNAYRILYAAPPISPPRMDWRNAALSCLLAAGIAVAATLGSAHAALSEKPAALLQPKAPKPGRRILLERIPFLWKRMNFSAKVTARNLFRYKKRLVMTVAGIAGCTALMLTGFGLQDSVKHIVSYQFSSVYRYNLDVSLQEGGISGEVSKLLNDKSRVAAWMECSSRSSDTSNASSPGGGTVSAYVVVPKNAADLPEFLSLRERVSRREVPFGKNSVVVTEKLASLLGLRPGGRIAVEDGAGKRQVFTVTGVTENYIYNFVYIDPALYRAATGRGEESNEILARGASGDAAARTRLTRDLLKQEGVATATFLDDISSSFDSIVRALDIIVLIFIFCAGTLSFVVLYNLTNININERAREMATLRVLGFTVRECEAYIYRETTVLTAIGCALGLALGVYMHAAVVTTVEVDICMFPRDIVPRSYFWSILLTFGFTGAVDLIMRPRFRKIDMVESLKSVD
jgi:putative ABC transport system permease protein